MPDSAPRIDIRDFRKKTDIFILDGEVINTGLQNVSWTQSIATEAYIHYNGFRPPLDQSKKIELNRHYESKLFKPKHSFGKSYGLAEYYEKFGIEPNKSIYVYYRSKFALYKFITENLGLTDEHPIFEGLIEGYPCEFDGKTYRSLEDLFATGLIYKGVKYELKQDAMLFSY